MRYDCGTTSENPYNDRRFLALHRGWRGGQLTVGLDDELLILAATRGIPHEWLYAVFRWTPLWRKRFNSIVRGRRLETLQRDLIDNEASVLLGDGMRMIRLAGPTYTGAAPLWTKLDLEADPRSDDAIAAELGVNRQKVRRWRVNPVFDPLTGERLRPNRGTPIIESAAQKLGSNLHERLRIALDVQ